MCLRVPVFLRLRAPWRQQASQSLTFCGARRCRGEEHPAGTVTVLPPLPLLRLRFRGNGWMDGQMDRGGFAGGLEESMPRGFYGCAPFLWTMSRQ